MNRRFSEDPQAIAIRREVGKRIAYVRNLREINQKELGERMTPPRSKQAISQWEMGKIDASMAQLVEVARALNCSVHFLLSGLGTANVVSSPFQVEFQQGMPVKVVGSPKSEAEYVPAYYASKPEDGARLVIDDSMFPKWEVGDMVLFRPSMKPAPRKFVWARNTKTDEWMLRQYFEVRDPKRPHVSYELRSLAEGYAPIEEGPDIEIMGRVIQTTRLHEAL